MPLCVCVCVCRNYFPHKDFPSTDLIFDNLHPNTTAAELFVGCWNLLKKAENAHKLKGDPDAVLTACLQIDVRTGLSDRTGFVRFATYEQAEIARYCWEKGGVDPDPRSLGTDPKFKNWKARVYPFQNVNVMHDFGGGGWSESEEGEGVEE